MASKAEFNWDRFVTLVEKTLRAENDFFVRQKQPRTDVRTVRNLVEVEIQYILYRAIVGDGRFPIVYRECKDKREGGGKEWDLVFVAGDKARDDVRKLAVIELKGPKEISGLMKHLQQACKKLQDSRFPGDPKKYVVGFGYGPKRDLTNHLNVPMKEIRCFRLRAPQYRDHVFVITLIEVNGPE